MAKHKELIAWQKSMGLVDAVYKVTRTFPKEEMFGLSSQMRRAAVSIPSNLAEGCAGNSKKEFLQFIAIAHGSLAELETQVLVAMRQSLMPLRQSEELLAMIEVIGKLLTKLAQSLR